MSKTYISVNLRRLVEERAASKCEYCQIPSAIAFFPHEIDHVVAEKHEGKTDHNSQTAAIQHKRTISRTTTASGVGC